MTNKLDQANSSKFSILATLVAIVPLVSLAVSAYQFVRIEDEKLRQRSFENYHALVSKLGLQQTSSVISAATIYEMKNYPEYCVVSLSIIASYRDFWKSDRLSVEVMDLIKPDLEKACAGHTHSPPSR